MWTMKVDAMGGKMGRDINITLRTIQSHAGRYFQIKWNMTQCGETWLEYSFSCKSNEIYGLFTILNELAFVEISCQ